jgi:hypothetical protein
VRLVASIVRPTQRVRGRSRTVTPVVVSPSAGADTARIVAHAVATPAVEHARFAPATSLRVETTPAIASTLVETTPAIASRLVETTPAITSTLVGTTPAVASPLVDTAPATSSPVDEHVHVLTAEREPEPDRSGVS